MTHEPPRVWEALLERVLDFGVVGDSVLGDLREEHARRAASDPRAARAWYRRAALDITLRSLMGVPRVAADVLLGALRSVRRSPRLALAVAGTLALGLGANVTLFAIVDRLLLSPPEGIRDANDVRRIFVERPSVLTGESVAGAWLTYPDYEAWREVEAFSAVAAYTGAFDMTLGRGDAATKIKAKTASADFFPLLGVRPVLGRLFTPDDALAGAEPTVVLTESFWRRRFAADPGALGRRLEIGDGTYRVVGVTPASFIGVELEPADVFLNFEARARIAFGDGDEWRTSRNWWWLNVVARLAPGVEPAAAEAEATAAFLGPRPPGRAETDRVLTSSLVLADAPDAPTEVEVTRWLAGVSVLVLLVACANVANLLLVRAVRRRQELAVRTALGLGRRRLVAQILTESLVLATVGGVAAVLVAQWGGAVVRANLFPDVEFGSLLWNARTGGFTALAVVLATGLVGLVPALRSARRDVAGALKDGARGATVERSALRHGLLAVQAGLTVVLLVGAGLFGRSLREALDVELGFDPELLVTASLELEGNPTPEARSELYYRAVDEVARLPGVAASTFHVAGPFQGSLRARVRVEGWDSIPAAAEGPYAYPVGPDYFETMGMEIRRGRTLTATDHRVGADRAAVVNEEMERVLWPESGALGRCIHIREGPCNPVVGVVSNAARGELVEDPSMMYYVPFREPVGQSPNALVLRMTEAGANAPPDLRAVLGGLSGDVRFVTVQSYSEILAPELRAWRLGATVFAAFGALALLVAAVGLYSTLAFQVAQRRAELGIRSALGASAQRLLRAVVVQTSLAIVLGVVGGVVLAIALARGLETLLFQVTAIDPTAYVTAVTAVLALGVLAAAIPGWRATRADPVEALREG